MKILGIGSEIKRGDGNNQVVVGITRKGVKLDDDFTLSLKYIKMALKYDLLEVVRI